MVAENLTIAVLFADGKLHPEILEILESLPNLNLIGHTANPDDLFELQAEPPDLILLGLSGEGDLPEWLQKLPQKLPETAHLAFSDNWEPSFLIRAMQVGVRDFLTLPISETDLKAAIERVLPSTKLGQIIAVTGNKGGVGSTTIAINLAVALGDLTTERVVLVDLGRPFPDVAKFLDQSPTYSLANLIQKEEALDEEFLKKVIQSYSPKMDILHGAGDLNDQHELDIELLENILAELRSMYKLIVVDLSHWIDEVFLKVVQEAELVILLTGLTIVDMHNMQQLWSWLTESVQPVNKIKVVVNRMNTGHKVQLRTLEKIIDTSVFEILPSGYFFLLDAIVAGKPLGMVAPRSSLWGKINDLAKLIQAEVDIIHQEHLGKVAKAPAKRRFWVF